MARVVTSSRVWTYGSTRLLQCLGFLARVKSGGALFGAAGRVFRFPCRNPSVRPSCAATGDELARLAGLLPPRNALSRVITVTCKIISQPEERKIPANASGSWAIRLPELLGCLCPVLQGQSRTIVEGIDLDANPGDIVGKLPRNIKTRWWLTLFNGSARVPFNLIVTTLLEVAGHRPKLASQLLRGCTGLPEVVDRRVIRLAHGGNGVYTIFNVSDAQLPINGPELSGGVDRGFVSHVGSPSIGSVLLNQSTLKYNYGRCEIVSLKHSGLTRSRSKALKCSRYRRYNS